MTFGVSLLVDYEGPLRWDEFEVGLHGLLIEFEAGGARYRATYLPEVAREQGWSKLETVASLMKKAGFRGACTDTILDSISLTRYKSSKAVLSYGECAA